MTLPHFDGSTNRLDRMLLEQWDRTGTIRFKYYGDFDTINDIYADCKEDLLYVGNSNKDGSPVFVYNYDNIETNTIRDFKSLNIVLRKIKIKHYSNKELTDKEKSLLTFFKFFMFAYDNYEIKGLSQYEITEVSYIKS